MSAATTTTPEAAPELLIPADTQRDPRAGLRPWILRLVLFAALALGWELFSRQVNGLLVPSFLDIVEGLRTQIVEPRVWEAFLISNQSLALGFFAAVVTGVPVGFLMGRFRVLERILNPYNRILLVAPLAGFIPVLTLTVGLGITSRVIVVWSFAVVMVVVNCQAGVRQVPGELIAMARVFGSSELDIWKRVLLPGALPAVLVGFRIALGRAVTGMVIVELLMVSVGIGGLILRAQSFFRAGDLYAIVVLVVLEALVLISVLDWVSSKLLRWKQ